MNQKKTWILGEAPIPRALFMMGIPTMIGMLVSAFYNIVDAYFISGLGESQMGAISVVYPLGQVAVGIGLLFGSGASSFISRLIGKGDNNKANQVVSTSLYISLIVSGIFIIFSLLFLKPILLLLGATKTILPYAITYARIYIFSCIFNVFNVVMNNIITSEGRAKTTMFALISGAVCNIFLDPVFIYVLNFGVMGAALATTLSQIISTLIYVRFIVCKKSIFNFLPRNCCLCKEIMYEILQVGVPTLLFQLLTSLSILMTNIISKHYGDSVIAAMGVVNRIVSIGSLSVFGFIKGFQPIAGYSYGAKKSDRLKESIKVSIVWSSIFCLFFGLIISFFSKWIITKFALYDMKMIEVGTKALKINGLSFILFGTYTVYSSLFLALGKGIDGFILGALRQGIIFIPLIIILPRIFGLLGIIYTQPISDVLSFCICVFMAKKLHRQILN